MSQEHQLKTQMISELKPHQINKKTKLIATVITDCTQMVGITAIIQDTNQDVITLAIWNLAPLRSTSKELSLILPIGAKVIIKEPYVKKALDGMYNIRIDNPHCNLIIIKPNDPKYIKITEQDPEKFKESGNDYFKKQMYDFAVKYYSEALENTILFCVLENTQNDALKLKLLSNRSLCYLKLSRPSKAAEDAHAALKIDNDSIKFRYRYATALTNIRKHNQALDIIKTIDIKSIKSKSVQKEFETLKVRIYRRLLMAEKFNPMNPWWSPKELNKMSWEEREDIGNYFSSSIKIKYINNYASKWKVSFYQRNVSLLGVDIILINYALSLIIVLIKCCNHRPFIWYKIL